MKYFKRHLPYILIVILFLFSLSIWYLVYINENKTELLTVAFLDVGQGDAIYIEAPNGKQMLIDGGPSIKILQQLGIVMPFGDRSIDILLETHTDSDHIGGFSFVLDKYKVSSIIENGSKSETNIYKNIEKKILKKKINKIIANNKMHIILDKERDIYLDILFPDRSITKMNSNDGSIVARLVYGKESFMLTGDATIYTENLIGWNEKKEKIKSTVLKLGHHGSKTSSSLLWLEKVKPDIAIISVGKNNRYGHPHKIILDRLKNLNIPFLRTSEEGNIIFKTDGVKLSY